MYYPGYVIDGAGRTWYQVEDTDIYEASDDRDDLLRYGKIVTMYGLRSDSPVASTKASE